MLDTHYIVRIKSSMIEKEDLVQSILAIQLSLFFLLLLGATVINYSTTKRLCKPYYDNLTFLQNFELKRCFFLTRFIKISDLRSFVEGGVWVDPFEHESKECYINNAHPVNAAADIARWAEIIGNKELVAKGNAQRDYAWNRCQRVVREYRKKGIIVD